MIFFCPFGIKRKSPILCIMHKIGRKIGIKCFLMKDKALVFFKNLIF